ncbi:TPA: AAA family ATPase, partial [Streptococcus equi subsp. zooepidemicus]|nr:AAA family ATPase [Streptococcus equi subsp. zooepidemicus]
NECFSNHLLKEWGSGTKSLAIIAMYRAYALIEDKDIILGIEEPETNLHPQAQKRFIQSLSQNMLKSEVQTIFTTHSTVLIDELKLENILLVKRKPDSKRAFISSIKQVPIDFWNKYDIKESAHYHFFNLKNSEFFFAKHVVICESPIDAYVMESLIRPSIKNDIADISFISLDGVN